MGQVRRPGGREVRRGAHRLGRQGDQLRPPAGAGRFEARPARRRTSTTRRTKRSRACSSRPSRNVGNVPLVCDASSDFLSRPVDIRKYGIYLRLCPEERRPGRRDGRHHPQGPAGAQPRHAARLSQLSRSTPKTRSLWNTPPTFPIYVLMLVTKWLLTDIGGLGEDGGAEPQARPSCCTT